MSSQAAHRYAKALFELAEEKNRLQQVYLELQDFASLLQKQQMLNTLFYSKDIKIQEKQKTVHALLTGKTSSEFLHFLQVLIQKRREDIFDLVLKTYGGFLDKKLNRVRAKIVSATPLEKSIQDQIEALLGKSLKATILLDVHVDPNVLGGFVLHVQDSILDLSLRRQLDNLAAQLHHAEAQ